MKLHLPKLLRNSVLACITAVAGIATTTVGTATFTGGVVAFALSSQHVLAESVTIDADATWTAEEQKDFAADERINVQANANLVIDGATVTGSGVMALINGGDVEIRNDADVTISRLVLHDGYAYSTTENLVINGGKLTITDADTGSGNFWTAVLLGHWGGATSPVALSLLDGELNVENGTIQLGYSSPGKLDISGGVANIKKINLSSGKLDVSGGQLNIMAGGSISGGGSDSFLFSGGTIALGEGAVIDATLTMSGNASLVTTSSDSAFGTNIRLNLSDLVTSTGSDGSVIYTVMTGTGNKDLGALNSSNVDFGTYTMGKNWTYGTDGTIRYQVTSKDVEWSEGATLSWSATGSSFTTGGEFANGDNVLISTSTDVTVGATEGVQASSMIVQGEGTHVKLTNSNPIYVGSQVIVKDGAVLEIAAESGGSGVIRAESSGYGGEIVVEDGGVLSFSAKDVTGYNNNNNCTRVISVETGGTLELNHNSNETFTGTLNLDGVLKGVSTAGAGRWDMFNGSAINVGAGAAAKMENVSLCLRRNNAVVTVGDGGSLTLENGVSSQEGNGILVKAGAGALVIQGETNINGFTVNGGSVEMTNTEERTMTISGAAGTTLTKNGAGNINMGDIRSYTYQGELVVNDGNLKFTSEGTEQAASKPGFALLFDNLVTNGDGKAVVEGDVNFNYQSGAAQDCISALNGDLEVTGSLDINSYASGSSPDGDSMRRWSIESDGSLSVGGSLWLTNKQKMVVSGGSLEAAGGVILGHGGNNDDGVYKSKLQLDSGSMSISSVEFKGGHNSVVMNGGELEFTSENAFTGGSTNNSNEINLLGGTLKASSSNVNLTGTSQHNLTLGGINIDIATGKTVTLGGTVGIASTVKTSGEGTLQLDSDLVLAVNNIGAFERGTGATYTDFDGSTTSGNGFFAGSIRLISGNYNKAGDITVQVGDTTTTNCVEDSSGLSATVSDDSTYFVNSGTVTLTETKTVSSFYIATGAELAYEAGDFTATLSGSGTYRPAAVMQTSLGVSMTPGITLASDWKGTVEIANSQIMGVNFNSLGTAQSSVKVSGLGTWINMNSTNILTNLILENYSEERSALIITDHSSGQEYKFRGTVSGTGDFEVASRAASSCTFEFSGDTSNWSGDIFASTSFNGDPYEDKTKNTTPNFNVKLTGAGDIFKADADSTIKMNRAGTMYLQIGHETEDSVLNATIDKNAGNIEITVNHGGSKTTVAKEVNATKLTVNGYGEFLENVTLSGNIAFSGNQSNRLVLHGSNNVANVIDLSNSNAAVGVLELKKGATVTSRSSLWMRPDASILLEEGASVIWDNTKITGKAGSVAEIKATSDAAQWMTSTSLEVLNAAFEVSKNESRTVAALLQNSSVINSGTALVTVTNSGNTLTGVEAKAGNVMVQNDTTGSAVSLGSITAADGLSVTAEMAAAQVSAITLGAGATFSTNGALTVADGSALSLGADAGVSMNGVLTLGSGLAITVNDISKDTTLFSGVTSIATSLDDITSYISSINGLTDLSDYTLSLENGNLVLVVDKGKVVTWDASNAIWENNAQFGDTADEADIFINDDMVVFGNLAADEAVTIKGEVHAVDMDVDASAGKTYTFTADANGGTLTVPVLSITSGKAVFGANTIQLGDLYEVTIEEGGELDLTAYGLSAFSNVVTKTTGAGTVLITGDSDAGNGSAEVKLNDFAGQSLELGCNYQISNSIAIHGGQKIDDNEKETLLVSKTLSVANVLRVESGATVQVTTGGQLIASEISIGHGSGNTNSVSASGHVVLSDGTITAGAITATGQQDAGRNTFTMTDGVLNLTGNGGIDSRIATIITGGTLKAEEASWGITGATIGGATVAQDGTLSCAVQIQTAGLTTNDTADDTSITLTNATLTSTLDNAAGRLVLAGNVTINGEGFNKQTTLQDFSNGGTDGFATTDTYYQIVTAAGNLTIAEGATWSMGEYVDTGDKAGWVRVDGTTYGDTYYLNSDGSTTLDDIKAHAGTTYTLSRVALNGGDLEITETDADITILGKADGTIKLTDADTTDETEVVLKSSQLTVDSGKTVTLTGNGVYDLGTATMANVSGLTDSAWTGVIALTGAQNVNASILNSLGNSGSSITLSGVTMSLGNASTCTANLELLKVGDTPAITHNSGSGTQKFTGAVGGEGSFVWAGGTSNETIHFAGDVSDWSGEFVKLGGAAMYLKFSGSTEINATLTCETGTTIGGLYITIDDADLTTAGTEIVFNSTINSGDNLNNARTGLIIETDTKVKLAGNVTVADFTNRGTTTVGDSASLAVTRNMTNSGSFITGKDLSVAGTFANTGSYSSTADLTLAGAASGTGSLSAKSLTLKGATNTVGDLTLTGGLTMGVAAAEGVTGVVSTLTASTLDITGDVVVNNLAANLISAGAAGTAGLKSSLNFVITDTQLEEYMEANTVSSIALGSIAGMTGTDWVKDVSLNKTTDDTNRWNADQMTYLDADGQYSYVLSADANGVLTLNRVVNGQSWDAEVATDRRWSNGASWSADTDVGSDDSVQFTGLGSQEVYFGTPGKAATETEAAVAPQKETLVINNVTFNIDTTLDGYNTSEYVFKRVDGTDWNTLEIKKNLTLISGKLTVETGVNIYSEGSTIVSTDAELHLDQQAFVRAEKGIQIGGKVTVDAYEDGQGVTSSSNGGQLYVIKGGNIDITTALKDGNKVAGDVAVGGILAAVSGDAYEYDSYLGNKEYTDFSYNANGSDINNAGSVENTGIIIAEGDMVNSGTLAQSGTDSRLWVYGNLSNTGTEIAAPAQGETKTPGMSITGGSVVAGTLTNSDTVNLSGGASLALNGYEEMDAATSSATTVAGKLTNTGALSIADGAQVTVGSSTAAGSVDNDGTITIGGAKDATGTVTTGMTVYGNLDNTNGTITIGSAAVLDDPDTDADVTAAATYGSLEVTGDLTGTGSADKLVVEEGSSLKVGGNLDATDVDLAFGGTVTVGDTATVNELTIGEEASFTAYMATIGTLYNDGSLSVGKDVDGTLTGGVLDITTLTGAGDVNVGTGGTLSITNDADFTGKINSEGAIVVTGEATLSTQTDKGGDITTTKLTVTEEANGSSMGTLKTGGIVIESMTTEAPSLYLDSIVSNAAEDKVAVTLTQMTSTTGVDGIISAVDEAIADDEAGLSYHLLSIANGTGAELELVEDVASHQYLLKQGYNHSDLMSTASYALDVDSTDAYISFWKQDEDEATWDMAVDTTNAGLIVRGADGMLSDDILDKVQKVVMTGEQTIDLTGDDLTRLTLNKLTNTEDETDSKLTLVGDADDTVTISDADYAGTVVLNTLSAEISGTVGTIEAGEGTGITADVVDTTINVNGSGVLLRGSMENGTLNIAQEAGVTDDSVLGIYGTDLNIAYDDKGATTMDTTDVSETGQILVDLGNMTGSAGDIVIGKDGKNSALLDKYFTNIRFDEGVGAVVADRNTSYYSDKAGAGVSANGAAGLAMADTVLVKLNPQAAEKPGALATVLDMLDTATGSAADELGASLAGAGTAVLGMAVSGDVDRQLQAIRNRTTTMGVDQSVANEDMPYFNAWINAEGDRSELSESGTEGGYELNSWGGTVGFDVDFCPTFTAGMALTAMYGDLDTTGADKASGDIDTYYVTAFARYAPSAWTHTFVATIGMSDISLDRHVAGAEVEGETDGLSFGLMYEVGRVFALDEDGTTCLQPVFNVTWKHTTVDAYTEDGGDLALEVDEQTIDTVTFGLGARLQTVVGESMYNRTSILEARVLAKADVGDRSGSADVALAALPGAAASVDSAEMGAFGLEAGAGLTIPVGDEGGSIFMDASVELRSDYTNVNGTVGYRINF